MPQFEWLGNRTDQLPASLILDEMAYASMGDKAVSKNAVRCYTHISRQFRLEDPSYGPIVWKYAEPGGEEEGGHKAMMDGTALGTMGWWMFTWIVLLIGLVVMVGVVVVWQMLGGQRRIGEKDENPEDALRRWLAQGQISPEDYDQVKSLLRRS
jgi:uncharacterized membrane protein